jgi:hypothetical protein
LTPIFIPFYARAWRRLGCLKANLTCETNIYIQDFDGMKLAVVLKNKKVEAVEISDGR